VFFVPRCEEFSTERARANTGVSVATPDLSGAVMTRRSMSPLTALSSSAVLSGLAQSPLDKQVKWHDPFPGETTWMSNKEKESIQLLQGTLDLIVLRTLATMGSQHAYQIATRLQQISDRLLNLNQGTLYPALIRLEQYGWIKGIWGRTESNREAKFYEITKAGQKALGEETQRWRKMAGLVERILVEES
jgi:PadR family transcriptional regulator PadR